MFCVYSGEGVNSLREHLKLDPPDEADIIDVAALDPATIAPHQLHHPQMAIQHGIPYYMTGPIPPFHGTQHHHPHHQHPQGFQLPPPPPHHMMPPHLMGQALPHHVGPANRPPPPPPAHVHMPHIGSPQQQPPQALMPTADDDEDVDEDMRVDEERE